MGCQGGRGPPDGQRSQGGAHPPGPQSLQGALRPRSLRQYRPVADSPQPPRPRSALGSRPSSRGRRAKVPGALVELVLNFLSLWRLYLGAAGDESAANLRAGRRAGRAAVSAPALGGGAHGAGPEWAWFLVGGAMCFGLARRVAWSPALLRPPAFPQPPRRSSRSDLLPPFPRSRAPISPELTRARLHKLLLSTKRVCGLAALPEVWPALRRPRPLQGNAPQTRMKSQLG